MPDRDAFGNEPGGPASPIPGAPPAGVPAFTPTPQPSDATANASAATGLSGGPTLSAQPQPMHAPTSGLPPVTLSNVTASRASGSGGRRWLSTIITLIVAALIIGIPLKLAIKTGKNAVSSINNQPFNPPATPTTGSGSGSGSATPSSPPTGLHAHSLLTAAALTTLVAHLHGRGHLTQLVLRPDYAVALSHTATKSYDYTRYYNGRPFISTSPAAGFGALPTIPLSKIDVHAPSVLLKHTKRSADGVDHVILEPDPITHQLHWLAYYKGSVHHFQADAHGGNVTFIR